MSEDRAAGFDVALVSALVSKVQLADVFFLGILARTVRAPVAAGELSIELPVAPIGWKREGQTLHVGVSYEVNVLQDVGGTPTKLVTMKVTLRLDYVIDESADPADEQIHHFVGISAFMHSWPFLRAEIMSLSTKLRLPPLVLPVVLSGHAAERVSVHKLPDAGPGASMPTTSDAPVSSEP